MLRASLVIIAVLLLLPDWSGEPRRPLYGRAPTATFTRVPLDMNDTARVRVGRLTFLDGVRMRSDDPAFGGFSAMVASGGRLLLLSDAGLWFGFRLARGFTPVDQRFGSLDQGPGSGWSRTDRDTESLARDPVTGRLWVGYESPHAVWRYGPDLARAQTAAAPAPMRGWPQNGGAEAMVRLRDGRFVIISEKKPAKGLPGTREALLFSGDPTEPGAAPAIFAYRPPPRHSPTDAAELPDGRLLVLNRRAGFRGGFTGNLTIIDTRAIRPGAIVAGDAIADLAAPLLHDNYEALAVTREGAATIVWIASDDNFSRFQQSLLLKFRLESEHANGPPSPKKAGR